MIIMASTLINAINNVRHVTSEELTRDTVKACPDLETETAGNVIIRIAVDITENHRKIEYTVDTRNGKREFYTEKTVPYSVIRLINYSCPTYHEVHLNSDELFIYSFVN